jgi:lysine-N-methylase
MMKNSEAIKPNVPSIPSPTYAAAFQCIGASCEDNCCSDNWEIPVDRSTYEKYQQLPFEKLGSVVSQFVVLNPPGQPDSMYAHIHPAPSGTCPFFAPDHLCRIQKEYDPSLLSATCSMYPRSLSRVAGAIEGSLSLSCPEAARNVLLDPEFMQIQANLFSGAFRTDNIFDLASDRNGSVHKPDACYLAIRTLLIGMVRERSHPMGHRLLLIGSLCKRMDEIATTGDAPALAEFLKDPHPFLQNEALRLDQEHMPAQPGLRFEVIFALSDARLRAGAGSRFQDTFWAFVECVDASNPGDDIKRFLHAEQQYHRPFFEKFPFVLENHLTNYMFQNLFPYGRAGSASFTSQNMFEEFLQMAIQFAWVNALLVGVAGRNKNAFADEHVVQTIQSFARAVEHYPNVIKSINQYVKSRGLDTLQGMAIMLGS